ncbi:MAG TPA: GNAT family N-acetyltransferase [Acidimicrobiales bacterium]
MIRDAASGDRTGLQSVFERASLSNPGDRVALEAHPIALVFTPSDDPTSRCRVATDDRTGTIVGFVTTTRAGDALELVDLFVDPARMRRGIARSLLDDVVDHARAAGVERIGVDGNPQARAFYEAVGFVVEATVLSEFGPGLRMGRSL